MKYLQYYELKIKKEKEQEFKDIVKNIIYNKVQKTVCDFSSVYLYVNSKFKDIDITSVPIYMVSFGELKKIHMENAGGLFIPSMNIILIKEDNDYKTTNKSKFFKELQKYRLYASIEDIVVHECLHAISHKSSRRCSKYSHLEEEFVYTNCIDFYKQKGMSVSDIIENIFLPFCIQDVFQSKKEINDIIKSLNAEKNEKIVDFLRLSTKEQKRIQNKYAEFIVDQIVDRAKKRGYKMVDYYNKNGQVILSNNDETEIYRELNMECDI